MGTNFYLVGKKKTVEIEPKIHISKRSYGWKPHFDASKQSMHIDYDDLPVIGSIADIKRMYDSGDWKIVDEYGEEHTWEEFDKEVLHWGDNPVNSRESCLGGDFRDDQGYLFSTYEFC